MITPSLLSLATDTAPMPVWSIPPWPCRSHKKQSLILEGKERIILRHHKGAFVGCFSLRPRKNINWKLFREWKEKRYSHITEQMARDFTSVIMNHYDFITAAPPSARRHPSRYCV